VTVTAGNTANLSRTLTAIPAVLNIDVTPSGAIIYLNNQPLSHVTPYTLSLDAGKYYVKTTLPNYTVFEKTVNLSYGDVVTLNDVMSDAEPPITCTASDSPIVTQDSLSTTTLYAGSEVDLSVSTSSPAQSMVAELAGPNGYVYFILHQVDNTGQHWSVVLHPTEIGNFNVTRYFVTVDGKTRTEQSINNLAFSVLTEPVDSGSQPTANFIPARTYGYVAFAARFTDTSTNLPTSWNWNFGDSHSSTMQNPKHNYITANTYNVSLTTTNVSGTYSVIVISNVNLTMGNPTGATTDVNNIYNYLLDKPQFCASYDRDKGIPNWTSWQLNSTWSNGPAARKDNYIPDSDLPSSYYHVDDNDYSGSGFSRGHMCPSADRLDTQADNDALFVYTNMVPQNQNNNAGAWEGLETYERTLANAGNVLYIISGGYGAGGTKTDNSATVSTISGGKVTVPAKLWKVIIVIPNGSGDDISRVTTSTRTIAMIIPNDSTPNSTSTWGNYRVSVDAVEALTGYDFFSNVAPSIQAVIESKVDSGPTN